MVKITESAIKIVKFDKLNVTDKLEPKGNGGRSELSVVVPRGQQTSRSKAGT